MYGTQQVYIYSSLSPHSVAVTRHCGQRATEERKCLPDIVTDYNQHFREIKVGTQAASLSTETNKCPQATFSLLGCYAHSLSLLLNLVLHILT